MPPGWPPWRSSDSRTGLRTIPMSSPAASGSAFRSRARSSATGTCSSPTSRRGPWIRKRRGRDAHDSHACHRGMAAVVVTHDAQLASGPTGWCSCGTGASSTRPSRRDARVAAPAGFEPMSVPLLERPAEKRAENGGAPARRAVIRWAWRLFRREWRQQLLVLALIVIAVAATVVGAAVATTTPPPANAGFGTAQDVATFQPPGPHLATQIAALQRRFGRVDVIENQAIAIPGSISTYDLRAQNPRGPVRAADAVAGQRVLSRQSRPGRGDPGRGVHLRPQGRGYVAAGRSGPPADRHRAETRRAC